MDAIDRILSIAAILFGGGGILSYLLGMKRAKAQNTLDVSGAWEKFSKPLMQRLADLEKKVPELEDEVDDLRGWAERLAKQVIDMGGTPVPFIRRKIANHHSDFVGE
jgi:hypothetical protein